MTTPVYGMGAVAADYDNDGFVDLYVTGLTHNVLYHNNGDGTFTDVSARRRGARRRWSTSAARRHRRRRPPRPLVGRYVDYSVEKDYFCGNVDTGVRVYCHPSVYPPVAGILYRNKGDGTFQDVTKAAGLDVPGKELAVTFVDIDGDGSRTFVANDTVVNFLFRNLGNGKFEDISLISGTGSIERKAPGRNGHRRRRPLPAAVCRTSSSPTSISS
jgi:hypothetical protein